MQEDTLLNKFYDIYCNCINCHVKISCGNAVAAMTENEFYLIKHNKPFSGTSCLGKPVVYTLFLFLYRWFEKKKKTIKIWNIEINMLILPQNSVHFISILFIACFIDSLLRSQFGWVWKISIISILLCYLILKLFKFWLWRYYEI